MLVKAQNKYNWLFCVGLGYHISFNTNQIFYVYWYIKIILVGPLNIAQKKTYHVRIKNISATFAHVEVFSHLLQFFVKEWK